MNILRRVINQMDEPSKHVRLETDQIIRSELAEKMRRESADSGTSSSEPAVHRTGSDSPLCIKSESDSGRPDTPPVDTSTPKKNSNNHNPFSVSSLIRDTARKPTQNAAPNQISAFSNPSLHSAAVHHRNLQAAAAANALQFQNLQAAFQQAAAAQAAQAAQAAAASQSAASSTLPFINPLFNPLLSQYNSFLQQRPNPLSK